MTVPVELRALLRRLGVVFRFVPERRLAVAFAASAPLWLLPGTVGIVLGTVGKGRLSGAFEKFLKAVEARNNGAGAAQA